MNKVQTAVALLPGHVLKVVRFNNPRVTNCTDAYTKSPRQALALYSEGLCRVHSVTLDVV